MGHRELMSLSGSWECDPSEPPSAPFDVVGCTSRRQTSRSSLPCSSFTMHSTMHSSMLRTRIAHPAMQACGAPHGMLQQRPEAVACAPAGCMRPAAPSASSALALAAPRIGQARSRSTAVCAGPPVGPSISAVSVLPAAANAINLIGVGHYKANIPPGKTFLLGILAGIHISFGGFLMFSLGGNMPGVSTNPPLLVSW
jgi:hypothetical protein